METSYKVRKLGLHPSVGFDKYSIGEIVILTNVDTGTEIECIVLDSSFEVLGVHTRAGYKQAIELGRTPTRHTITSRSNYKVSRK